MSTTTKLSKDAFRKVVEQNLYESMIGSLLYLTASPFDISFSVGAWARYQTNPKESHLVYVKRIIHYINGTLDYGLWYPYDSFLVIVGYSDADRVGNVEDRKNTFGACFLVGDCLMAWLSKKQNFVSLSTTEDEYIVVGSCSTQLLWMKKMLKDYEIKGSWTYTITILVLLIYQRIVFFILVLNTLKFVITLLRILLKKRLSLYSLSLLNINW